MIGMNILIYGVGMIQILKIKEWIGMRSRRHRAVGKVLLQRKVKDRPIWIENKCGKCGSKLVPYIDSWYEETFDDEWECANCTDGIYIDIAPKERNELKKVWLRFLSKNKK